MPNSLAILHVVLSIGETSAPYNEHCLPWAEKRDITICTYFKATVRHPSTIRLFEGNGSLLTFFGNLKAALAEKEYDIVHVHAPHLGLLFLIAKLFILRKVHTATLFTVHDSYPNYKLRNRLMLLPIFAGFQKIVCCSLASFNSFPKFYRWLAGDRVCAVQNGLDIDRVDRVAATVPQPILEKDKPSSEKSTGDKFTGEKFTGDKFTVVAISRLVAIKNPFAIVAAFQQGVDPQSRLVYIGDGVLRDELLAKSREGTEVGQIEFTGLIPRETVFAHLLNADLFVSASRGEGLPISVLEAMACGCPVVLSDIAPHREIASLVDCIPLIAPDDVDGFARALKQFCEMPAMERVAIGKKCRKLVEERFSVRSMHAGYSDLYAQLCANRPLGPVVAG